MKFHRWVCVSFFFVATSCSAANVRLIRDDKLAGLKSVSVYIENVGDEVKADGLTDNLLKTQAELHLRKAGIPVKGSSYGNIYVNVNAVKLKNGDYAYSIDVCLRETVTVRGRTVFGAHTWSTGSCGYVPQERMHTAIADYVGELVDEFANEWLKDNPRQS